MGLEDLVLLAAIAGGFSTGMVVTQRLLRRYLGAAPRWRVPSLTERG